MIVVSLSYCHIFCLGSKGELDSKSRLTKDIITVLLQLTQNIFNLFKYHGQSLPDLLSSFSRLVYGTSVKRALKACCFTGRFVELKLQNSADKVPNKKSKLWMSFALRGIQLFSNVLQSPSGRSHTMLSTPTAWLRSERCSPPYFEYGVCSKLLVMQ